MTRAVDMRIVALVRLVLDMRRRDRDAARAFFGRLVDLVERHERRPALLRQHLGDRRRQRRLAVVDVADRPDIAVRLRPLKLRLRHCLTAFCQSETNTIPTLEWAAWERVVGIEPT